LNENIAVIFSTFLYLLIFAVIGRALLSWFPQGQNNRFARILYDITEPLLSPVRRIMPRTGMIDFSALIVILVLYMMIAVVNQAASS
jgi:YggT family protein